ncbi:RHS repeat-associated core domain-containing protein [Methylobacterium sp. OAE515]|uniref:RHS repeat-associated core domain-containing protein n=1 Tax=Methylobacterium sp. OAE515 TaxID=2817895 RepID=UPI00178A4CCD
MERVDGEGRRTVERYGAYGLLAEIEDPKGGRLRFGHDGLGRLERVENQLGRAWTFERDAAGRVVAETDFDGLRTTYAYDRAGRLTGKLAADGTRTVYAHDASGLLTGETVTVPGAAEPQVTTFAYDGAGQLVAARGGGSEVLLEWDGLGRVVAETVDGRRVESRYDCCGNRVERTGLGSRVESRYDPLGALTALEIAGHGALTLDHDAAGRELRRASAAGFVLESTWDAAGQLVRQVGGRGRSSGPGAGKFLERVYGWDRAYAPVSVFDLRWGGTGYRYDRNGQVVEGRHGDGSAERYGYDAALNVAEFAEADGPATSGGLVQPASYGRDPAGRLRAWRGSAGGRVEVAHGPSGERVTYRHDVCGRVVERVLERDGFRPRVWRYAWDGKDRLVGCTTPTGERWAYGYDPFGRRLWKRRTDAGPDAAAGDAVIGTAYGWDGDLLSAEAPLGADGSADWARATIWHYEPGTFRPLAREGSGGSLAYVVTDHLGTPRELVDADGRLLWSAEYRVWGAVRRVWVAANDEEPGVAGSGGRPGGGRSYAVAGNLALAEDTGAVEAVLLCPLRFQGQWQDGETGLVYNRFRYYDPITTQYASPDPIGLEAGTRQYGYVPNPNIFVDPSGLICCGRSKLQHEYKHARDFDVNDPNLNNVSLKNLKIK